MAAPTCIICKKKPEEILEYIQEAEIESRLSGKKITPTEWMMKNEGTYNRFQRNKFFCTSCYVKAGMPTYHY